MKFDEFLKQCTACGGNWSAMLMTGIERVAPDVYKEMPDRSYTFEELCFIAGHLCHDRPHLRYNISINGDIIEYGPDAKFHYRKATDEERALTSMEFDVKYNGMSEEEYSALVGG